MLSIIVMRLVWLAGLAWLAVWVLTKLGLSLAVAIVIIVSLWLLVFAWNVVATVLRIRAEQQRVLDARMRRNADATITLSEGMFRVVR